MIYFTVETTNIKILLIHIETPMRHYLKQLTGEIRKTSVTEKGVQMKS